MPETEGSVSVKIGRGHARAWAPYIACGGLVLVALLAWPSKQRGSNPEVNGDNTEDATLEAIASALHRAEKRCLGKHGHHESASGVSNKFKTAIGRITTSEWLMVFFTAVIAIVGGVSAYIAHGQQTVMQGQLQAMEYDQRPWIKVTPGQTALMWHRLGPGNSEMIAFGSPPIWVENVGHSPAFNVIAVALSYVDDPKESMEIFQKRICDNLRANWHQQSYGQILFPGERADASETPGGGALGFGIEPSQIKASQTKGMQGKKLFTFDVVGCADYTFAKSLVHHQTYFSYLAKKVTESADGRMRSTFEFNVGEDVPNESFRLDRLMNNDEAN